MGLLNHGRSVTAIFGLMILASSGHAAKVYNVHTDHLGTPQVLTDENHRVVWSAEYQPFGQVIANEDPDGDGETVEFNLRFPGQYYDKSTGVAYNYYRDYDAGLGRYIQSDPIGLRGGLNTYGYAYSNPYAYVDLTGEVPQAVVVVAIVVPALGFLSVTIKVVCDCAEKLKPGDPVSIKGFGTCLGDSQSFLSAASALADVVTGPLLGTISSVEECTNCE